MKQLIFVLFGAFFLSGKVDTTSPESTSAKVKTVFLYNFTKYIDWPKNYKTGSFVIGVLGPNPYLVSELNEMATKKKAGSQSFEIKNLLSLDKNIKFHMLFVSPEFETSISDIENFIKGKNTLLVTEKPGLAKQNAAINFIVQNNRQKFELNRKNAEKYNLKVSSSLNTLAILIE